MSPKLTTRQVSVDFEATQTSLGDSTVMNAICFALSFFLVLPVMETELERQETAIPLLDALNDLHKNYFVAITSKDFSGLTEKSNKAIEILEAHGITWLAEESKRNLSIYESYQLKNETQKTRIAQAYSLRESAVNYYSNTSLTDGNLAHDLAEASNLLVQSCQVYNQGPLHETPNIFTLESAYRINQIHWSMGRLELCESISDYLIANSKDIYGENSVYYANVLNQRANIRISKKEYGAAKEDLLSAIKIKKQCNDGTEFSYIFALSLCDYAYLLLKQKEYDECLRYLDEIDTILSIHPELAISKESQAKANRTRGLYYHHTEQLSKAHHYLNASLHMMITNTVRYSPDMFIETLEACI